MMGKVKIGVIGVGAMGQLFSRIFNQMETVELVALADVDKSRIEDLATELGVTYYLDYRDLLGHPSIDAVAICLPDQLHTDAALAAARARKHLFIEKRIKPIYLTCVIPKLSYSVFHVPRSFLFAVD
jgi:predicted dehydrogenase